MLDDWRINWELGDLPPEVWDFLKAHKFFAMIIPKKYGGLEFSAYAHSEVDPQALDPLDLRGGHRHGAELARPGRAAAAVRHRGAAGLLAAAARRGEGDSLLRADQPGGRLGRRLDDRYRRGLPRHLAKAARCSASGSTGTSATSRSVRSRPCWASPSSSTIPTTCSAPMRTSASRSRWCRRNLPGDRDRPPAPARDAGLPERPELGPRRVHPDGPCHRRRRAGRQGLEDADERARGRARHLAAVAVGGGRAPSPRTPPAPMRACASSSTCRSAASRRSRNGSAASPPPPICSTPRGGTPAPASTTATSRRWSPPS